MVLPSRTFWWVAAALTVSLLAPLAHGSVFTVRGGRAASDPIDSLSKASRLLDGTLAVSGEINTTAIVINFADPQSPARGRFGNAVPAPADAAFPGDTGGDDNNFAIFAEANVVIPAAGAWTFGVNADNGVRVRIGANVMSRSGFESAALLSTFTFPSVGTYPLTMTYYEHTGQSGIELFAAAGAVTSATDASFRLVGDAANGGLAVAPEPTGVMPLAMLAALLVRRRRRLP
jgi:MYXO-CTERM domain-containing protein